MKKGILITLVVLLVIGLGIFFYFSSGTSSSSYNSNGNSAGIGSNSVVPGSVDVAPTVIYVNASRFAFAPNIIRVKQGKHVKIVIDNKDTVHGMIIPDLGVSGIDSVEFTADKAGTFAFRCPTMCGSGHRDMTGTLIVE